MLSIVLLLFWIPQVVGHNRSIESIVLNSPCTCDITSSYCDIGCSCDVNCQDNTAEETDAVCILTDSKQINDLDCVHKSTTPLISMYRDYPSIATSSSNDIASSMYLNRLNQIEEFQSNRPLLINGDDNDIQPKLLKLPVGLDCDWYDVLALQTQDRICRFQDIERIKTLCSNHMNIESYSRYASYNLIFLKSSNISLIPIKVSGAKDNKIQSLENVTTFWNTTTNTCRNAVVSSTTIFKWSNGIITDAEIVLQMTDQSSPVQLHHAVRFDHISSQESTTQNTYSPYPLRSEVLYYSRKSNSSSAILLPTPQKVTVKIGQDVSMRVPVSTLFQPKYSNSFLSLLLNDSSNVALLLSRGSPTDDNLVGVQSMSSSKTCQVLLGILHQTFEHSTLVTAVIAEIDPSWTSCVEIDMQVLFSSTFTTPTSSSSTIEISDSNEFYYLVSAATISIAILILTWAYHGFII